MTFHRSQNVPLEAYELTSRDHRDQKTSEEIRDHVERLAGEWRDEELADPKLRERRLENARSAWKIVESGRPHDSHIMRWRVRLYCGHIVEVTRHVEVAEPTMHGSSSTRCSECGMNPARIVAFEPIGPLGEATMNKALNPAASQPKPRSRKQLEARVAELEAELAAMRNTE
ncbi:hypothetical protein [Rhodococcus sp. AD45]|uniref:hypothetical protein n=1 Tax=Rhodococcus sp. (strain AD45) TaxID=103808 RepID=UPI0005D33735|nr:hypothetical protein [Rhodococcus sp. AD45]